MPFDLDQRSQSRLGGVHVDLVAIIQEAARVYEHRFIVTEGLRSLERQRELVASGASQTMRSRHLTGHAVDLAVKIGGEVRWDWPLYERLATVVKAAAEHVGKPVEWGGDWTTLKDGPHFQLPWEAYP